MLVVCKFASKIILFQKTLLFKKQLPFAITIKLWLKFMAKFHLLLHNIFPTHF
jgi:hypothetical protein